MNWTDSGPCELKSNWGSQSGYPASPVTVFVFKQVVLRDQRVSVNIGHVCITKITIQLLKHVKIWNMQLYWLPQNPVKLLSVHHEDRSDEPAEHKRDSAV